MEKPKRCTLPVHLAFFHADRARHQELDVGVERRCPECGFEARRSRARRGGGMIRENAAGGGRCSPDRACARPADDVWSPLEYGCHVRDVFRICDGRLELMLTEDDPHVPELGPGRDRDRRRATARRIRRRSRRELARPPAGSPPGSTRVTASSGRGPARAATAPRSPSSRSRRYVVHDVIHHLVDVGRRSDSRPRDAGCCAHGQMDTRRAAAGARPLSSRSRRKPAARTTGGRGPTTSPRTPTYIEHHYGTMQGRENDLRVDLQDDGRVAELGDEGVPARLVRVRRGTRLVDLPDREPLPRSRRRRDLPGVQPHRAEVRGRHAVLVRGGRVQPRELRAGREGVDRGRSARPRTA